MKKSHKKLIIFTVLFVIIALLILGVGMYVKKMSTALETAVETGDYSKVKDLLPDNAADGFDILDDPELPKLLEEIADVAVVNVAEGGSLAELFPEEHQAEILKIFQSSAKQNCPNLSFENTDYKIVCTYYSTYLENYIDITYTFTREKKETKEDDVFWLTAIQL